ncbi:prepilin-type N-terminal cleavage/methylation domain-containing protein [Bacteroidota bacterium]|nr:prepilin-type N-terminal cleavage/methylation domain-containing protein [Bacteroidota bacterium]
MKTKISQTFLNKGFTLLELLIVISIISLSAGTFYLLFQTPQYVLPIQNKVQLYRDLSIYTGNSYYFNEKGIYLRKKDNDTLIDDHNLKNLDYIVLQNDEILKLDSDSKFIIISPSYEISTKEIILQNGTKINIE